MMRYCLLLSIVLAACTSEEGVKVHNADPKVSITSHVDEDTVFADEVLALRATVSDDDNTPSELSVQWRFGERTACPFTPADTDGVSLCEAIIAAGEETITVEVRDPSNALGSDSVRLQLVVSEPPTAVITQPSAGTAYYREQLIPFTAMIADAEDELIDLQYRWESSLDGLLDISGAPESSGEIEGFVTLSEGQHAISLTVEDTSGKTTTESVVVEVGGPNTSPVCAITAPINDAVYVLGQDIQFSATATDADIDNSLLTIGWESNQDGVFDITAANSAGELELRYDGLSQGNHVITLRVEDEAGGVCTDTVLVSVGSPPSLSLITPSDGDVYALGQSVLFSALVADADDLLSDIELAWVSDIDGQFSSQGADSSGNVSFSYADLSAGQHSLLVTATDTSGLTASASLSLSVNTPPTMPVVSLSPNPATSDQNLQATATSSDADGDALTYTYSWFKNAQLTSITDAYVPAADLAVADVWKVQVSATDGLSTSDYAEVSTVVANTEPVLSAVSISPNTGVTNDQVLTCSATASDVDEPVTPSYLWSIGNATYAGSTLDLATTSALPGANVTCTANVNDSHGGTASASAMVTLENRAPSLSSVAIAPTPLYTNNLAVCTVTATDADGEALSQSFSWSVGGNSLGSGDSLQLSPATVAVGDNLQCTVTVSDAAGATASDTVTVSISNSPPTIDSLLLTPSSPYSQDILTCNATATDADGDTPTLVFAWSNQTTGANYSSASSSATSATLELAVLSVAASDVIACTATATDTNGGSTSQTQTVTISNSLPVFTSSVMISPNSGVTTGTSLTCSASVSDPEDGILSPVYEWTVNNLSIGSGSTYVVAAADTNVGDSVHCTATAIDSDGNSITGADSVIIDNSPPGAAVISIAPASPTAGQDDLICQINTASFDADADPLSYFFSWTLNGQFYNGPLVTTSATDDTVPASQTAAADLWQCTVVANDGTSDGAPASASVMISDGCADPFDVDCDGWVEPNILSTGSVTTCALDQAGEIQCWGDNSSNQLTTMPTGPFEQLAMGGSHGCALDSSGYAACWGLNNHGQSNPPAVAFRQISIGAYHTCAIDTAGALHCWGAGTTSGNWPDYGQSLPPGGVYTSVASDQYHSCAVASDGSLACWGITNGDPSRDYGQVSTTPNTGTYVQVDTGLYYNCALDTAGYVTCWGRNDSGQGSPPASQFVQISAGWLHTCGLQSSGAVQCWGVTNGGNYDFGQVSNTPAGTFVQLSIGSYNSCAIDDTGSVQCWGWNIWGQSNPPSGFVAYSF